MDLDDELSRVRALSNAELMSGLNDVLRSSRRAVAQLVVHLGEVEERRLHLIGGYASLFAYCVSRLGMSEDEAYRRIEVARLARCYPSLLARLASGHISLSAAALLKSHLTPANSAALLDAVSGKTVQQAREVLAAWYPSPDVLPSIRKLPSPHPSRSPTAPPTQTLPTTAASATPCAPTPSASTHDPTLNPATRSHTPARPIEPLSADRYKLQLTASAELKRKLELSRDLLRHAVPNGDLATIIERALDVLLQQTLERRFAVTTRPRSSAPSTPTSQETSAARPHPSPAPDPNAEGAAAPPTTMVSAAPAEPLSIRAPAPSTHPSRAADASIRPPPATTTPGAALPATSSMQAATPGPSPSSAPSDPVDPPPTGTPMPASDRTPTDASLPTGASAPIEATVLLEPATPSEPLTLLEPTESPEPTKSPEPTTPTPLNPSSRHIPNHVRRAVFARDDVRCAWHGPDGKRCESRAWLEHDHITPRGRGGVHDAWNIRLLCRAHNRLAAEQAYGKDNIHRIIARQRCERATC